MWKTKRRSTGFYTVLIISITLTLNILRYGNKHLLEYSTFHLFVWPSGLDKVLVLILSHKMTLWTSYIIRAREGCTRNCPKSYPTYLYPFSQFISIVGKWNSYGHLSKCYMIGVPIQAGNNYPHWTTCNETFG